MSGLFLVPKIKGYYLSYQIPYSVFESDTWHLSVNSGYMHVQAQPKVYASLTEAP